MNNKSDRKAKEEFRAQLLTEGFDTAEITKAPADITATKNGVRWWFEIKQITKDKYFGAATETEWEQAFKDPDHYRFVIARTDEFQSRFDFIVYEPKEFLEFCSIPPFKVFFNIDLNNDKGTKPKSEKVRKSISFDENIFNAIHAVFAKYRPTKN